MIFNLIYIIYLIYEKCKANAALFQNRESVYRRYMYGLSVIDVQLCIILNECKIRINSA